MRVVLTVNFSPWSPYCGGGQQSTHNLATALAHRGHDVTVVYTRPPWERLDVPSDLPYAIAWAALLSRRSRSGALLRPLTTITVAHQVARLVEGHDDAIVHGNGEEAALIDRLRPRHRFAFVMTPRYPAFPVAMADGSWRQSVLGLRHWLQHPRYAVLAPALRGADRWCPTSEHAADAVQRTYGLDVSRRRVVPNGITPAFFEVERTPDADDGPLLFFGRMAREKGVPTLVEALLRLGDDAPPVTFVGRGPMVDLVRRRLANWGSRLELVPWLDAASLAARVAAASVVVLPSHEESFGNAMAEAMAVGAPVISTTAGSIPEVVVDGQTGLLVPPGEPAALADAIARLQADRDLSARLGQGGRIRARERYTWQTVARTFETVYKELRSR